MNKERKINFSSQKYHFDNKFNFLKRIGTITYMFIFISLIGLCNNYIFIGNEKDIETKVLYKNISHFRSSTNYNLFIHPLGLPDKLMKVSFNFFDKINENDLVRIRVKKNIFGLYVIKSYKEVDMVLKEHKSYYNFYLDLKKSEKKF